MSLTCPPQSPIATCAYGSPVQWKWDSASVACGARHVPPSSDIVFNMTRGREMLYLGDSLSRYVLYTQAVYLNVTTAFRRVHEDLEIALPEELGSRLRLQWLVKPDQVAEALELLDPEANYLYILISSCAWHNRDHQDSKAYRRDLQPLVDRVKRLRQERGITFFMLECPYVVPSLLPTAEVGLETNEGMAAYNEVIRSIGGNIWHRLRLQDVGAACGDGCNIDGLHQINAVYEAIVQQMLNILFQDQHKKPWTANGRGRPSREPMGAARGPAHQAGTP